jgi:peptide deformylase
VPDDWIRQWGDPALREVAAPILRMDDILRAQLDRLRRHLEDVGGAGLAATQVGLMRRAFAFRLDPEDDVDVLVNPRVVARSDAPATFLEGCLSLDAMIVAVQRPVAVRVEAEGLDGRARRLDVEGFGASLLQHEIDHLDGILTLDRAEPDERRRAIGALLARAA